MGSANQPRELRSTPPDLDEVELLLRAQLNSARDEFEAKKKIFGQVVAEVPSGLPHPDGATAVQIAGQQYRHALEAFDVALKRFTQFVVSGTVPDDLRK